MALKVGDPFPVVPVQSVSGSVDVATLWQHGPAVIAFHRLWCPFCQQAARELDENRAEFEAADASVALVYRDSPATVEARCSERGVSSRCVSDPGRKLEQAAQLKRFRARRYAAFAPSKLVEALRTGSRVGLLRTDPLQGRGTYVVGTDGTVAYAHTSETAADIPPIEDVMAAVRAAA